MQRKIYRIKVTGLSFQKISKEINVLKPTLIKWNQEYSQEISNLIFFHSENLVEQFKLLRIHKIESLSRTLGRVLEELSKRNFEKVSTKDLISLTFALENKPKESLSRIKCYTGITESFFDEEVSSERKTISILY